MIKLPCPAEEWPTFASLLYAALELPAEGHAAWLDQLPAAHRHLRPMLAQTLASAAAANHTAFLESAPFVAGILSDFAAGQRIGPYCLERELGRGGMGEVWLASRTDGALNRRIALKLPYAQFLSGALRQRFERERDILASLSHPHIAAVFDAGVSDSGHPFLAMEWIDGVTLTHYCRDRRLSIHDRLALFEQVLDAVDYAHTRLIAHRDLKPGNILVTQEGQVKLLDFGIAKLLDDAPGAGSELTLLGGGAVTPGYAAPEQLAGRPVTTAVDVYALGVILFELLCGARPFASRGDAFIRGVDAPLASRCVTAEEADLAGGLDVRSLRKRLEGDLDAILAKALEIEPEARYRSAQTFGADLDRHRRHLPISARRIGPTALAWKFVRRHRAVSGLTAGLGLALILGGAGIAWQSVRAQREAQLAEVAARRAADEARREKATKEFLVDMFRASDPRRASGRPSGTITAKELMDDNAERIQQQFADDPDVQIELLETAAEIYGLLDETERALQLGRVRLAALRERRGPLDPDYIEELIEEADLYSAMSRYEEASHVLDEADASIAKAGLDRSAHRALWWYEKATAAIADPSRQDFRFDALRKSVALYAAVAPTDHHYGYALADLGGLYFRHNDLPTALDYIRKSIMHGEQQARPDATHLTALYGNLGKALVASGDLLGAQEALSRATELVVKTYGPNGRFYWTAVSQQARVSHLLGDREHALPLFEDLLRRLPAASAGYHSAQEEASAARAREAYGTCLLREGRAAAAVVALTAAAHDYAEANQDFASRSRLKSLLGEAYDGASRNQQARSLLEAAVHELATQGESHNPELLKARLAWGNFLAKHGDLGAAETEFREILKSAPDPQAFYVVLATGGLARIAIRRHDLQHAAEFSSRAVSLIDQVHGFRDARMAPELWRIRAEALLLAGDAPAAVHWAERALEALRRYDAAESPEIAAAKVTLMQASSNLVRPGNAAGLRPQMTAPSPGPVKVPARHYSDLKKSSIAC